MDKTLPRALSGFVCHRLEGLDPTALPAMMVCLFSTPADGKPAENQKGPHRRCFRCPRIFRLAGIATGGVNSRYLTELLTTSRDGGHPWARATLGKTGNKNIRRHNQEDFFIALRFFSPCIFSLNSDARTFNYVEQTGDYRHGYPHPHPRIY